jgi:nucleoside-diphosphate-sugar epimerase
VRYCEDHPEECRAANDRLTEDLIALLLRKCDANCLLHVVFSSSSTVYGSLPCPWSEESPLDSQGAYEISKKTVAKTFCMSTPSFTALASALLASSRCTV